MTFTLEWLIFAFVFGALVGAATVIVLSALWVGRDRAPALPCGEDDDGPDDWTLTQEDIEAMMRRQL